MSPHRETSRSKPSSSPAASLHDEGESPTNRTRYLLQGEEDHKQLVLYSENKPDEKVTLCETYGWGDLAVSFSPDEQRVVVQDGGASLGVSLRLFRRKEGLSYEEVKEADIGGKAEAMALKQKFVRGAQILEHRYIHVLHWSADSRKVLFELSGRGTTENGRVAVSHWIGIYDVPTGGITTDLRRVNAAAVAAPR